MSTTYPTTIDTFTNPTATDQVAVVSHADQHANANDAIEALEAKVGANGSAVTTSHDYKLGEVTAADKAVGKTATQTLTNKTLTSPTITDKTSTGTDNGAETLTNKTITRPKIVTSIDDANGNEVIVTPATPSAVNEITVTNAATGNDPLIQPSGGDANVGLKLKGKGSGKVKLGDAELQFPDVDGTNTQVLQTNGSGELSWATPNTERFTIGGDGSDGSATISSGTTTLTRDMYYTTLTVNGTGTLETAGFRIYAKTSVTVDLTGGGNGIRNNGGNGGNASGATAGTAGTAGVAGTLPGGVAGSAGSAGSTNTFFQAVTGTAGNNAALGLGSAGVVGGQGALPTGTVGSAGGAGGTITGTIRQQPRSYIWANNLFQFSSSTATAVERYLTSASGGGGGGGSINGSSGTSGGGGGSAGSGGTVFIESPSIVLTGTGAIRAAGGTGGNGGNASGGSFTGGGGGGAGGSGGVVILIYQTLTGTGSATAPGGTGGSAGTSIGSMATPSAAGTTGNAGTVYSIKMTA